MTQANEQQVASEMVERVAKAIYESYPDPRVGTWEQSPNMWREDFRRFARAAISAMRDAALLGSSAGHQTSRCAPVLDSAAISDRANEERFLDPLQGPQDGQP